MGGQLLFDCQKLVAGAGGGQLGHAEAQPQPLGQGVEVGALWLAMAWMRRTMARSPPSPRNSSTPPGLGQGKCPNQGSPQATLTARSRAAQVLPALTSAARTP